MKTCDLLERFQKITLREGGADGLRRNELGQRDRIEKLPSDHERSAGTRMERRKLA